MVRTQIYLPQAQQRALRKEARARAIPLTELVRRIVAKHLEGRDGVEAITKEDVLAFVAIVPDAHAVGSAGRRRRGNVSERHDAALDEAFRAGALR